jgi:uncharacterized membrane protein YkvA (DUF1232 family)
MNRKLKKLFEEQFLPKASVLMINPTLLLGKLEEVKEKLSQEKIKTALGDSYQKLKLLWQLTLDYVKGNYRQISKNSMVKVISALIYFLIPLDFVPDFIFGLGLVDDVSVILWVYSSLDEEIAQYKEWRNENETTNS